MIKPEEGQAKRPPNWRDKLAEITGMRQEAQTGGTPFKPGAKTLGYTQMRVNEELANKEMALRKQLAQMDISAADRRQIRDITSRERLHAETMAFERWKTEQNIMLAQQDYEMWNNLRSAQADQTRAQTDLLRMEMGMMGQGMPDFIGDPRYFEAALSPNTGHSGSPTQQAWDHLFSPKPQASSPPAMHTSRGTPVQSHLFHDW